MEQKGTNFAKLYAVMVRLTALLDKENLALEEGRPKDIQSMLTEKTKLARIYSEQMGTLRDDAGKVGLLRQGELDEIKIATDAFHKSLDHNRRILMTKRQVTEGLIKAIGEEVSKRNRPVESYGKDATVGPAMPTYAAQNPTTLTLDRRI